MKKFKNENFTNCKKNENYDEKVKIFIKNNKYEIEKSQRINKKNSVDFSEIYKLFYNKNIILPNLPIFRYEGITMCFASGEVNSYEYGKYEELTLIEIEKYLSEDYIIFIKSILDLNYRKNDQIKYKVVVLKENIN